MMMRMMLAGAVLGFAALGGAAAQAAPITTLFNTGVDANGKVLADQRPADLHYVLASAPEGMGTGLQTRTATGGYPIGPWVGDDPLSTWIGPNLDSSMDGLPGRYDYRTTFRLDGPTPSTARISGRWSSDNEGVDILLNGHSIGDVSTGAQAYQNWHDFAIDGGFVAGLNTLDFIVNNDDGPGPNPTGLRVEMTGTAVPEPASLSLLGLGLLGLAGLRRRRG